jgi:hypothetical protein
VAHPEQVAFAAGVKTVVVVQPDNTFRIIDLPSITELQLKLVRSGRKAV